jgi:hypothetical protein
MRSWERYERGSGTANGEGASHLAPACRAMRDVVPKGTSVRIRWGTSQDGLQRLFALGAQNALLSPRVEIPTDPVASFDRFLHSLLAETKRLGNVLSLEPIYVLQPHNRAGTGVERGRDVAYDVTILVGD